jgi:feruloyl esterase
MMFPTSRTMAVSLLFSSAFLAACGGGDDDPPGIPQLSAATGATLSSCTDLATRVTYPNTTITAASAVAAGTLMVAGSPVPAHCLVTGRMFQRTSTVDGQTYAIGFEMRLPNAWNGRFFYQGNGGADGNVVTATGAVNGGGGLTNALQLGFAVISSDAGHNAAQNASATSFGYDPQARLDFGYQAVGKLTPMAKAAIQVAYGKAPDRSYIGGCSNGGRHAMVAASRYSDQYDGYLVGNPGFNLPRAATANIAGGQTYNALATTPGNLSTGFTTAERTLVSNAVLGKCDALDGASDGLVQDTKACQAAFDLSRDVPTCTGARDGTCLTSAQKAGIAKLFSGVTTSTGTRVYTSFPYDNGLQTNGWSFWKFTVPVVLDSVSVGTMFQTPPEPTNYSPSAFALSANIDTLFQKIQATDATYTESSLSFMTPPNPTDLSTLKNRGAKMMIYHGTADPIFSSDDTQAYIDNLNTANGGDATNFARFYPIPGMNHCSGGPATDQFDMLSPLIAWVEQGIAPESVEARVRGPGNPAGANADVPGTWSSLRSRPLCVYPKVARYKGSGSAELASSFVCQ